MSAAAAITPTRFKFAVNTHGRDKDWNFKTLQGKFRDKTGTLDDVLQHIKHGHAVCAGLLGGKWRKKANVIGSQWILLDIDNSDIWRDDAGNPLDENGKPIRIGKQPVDVDGNPIPKADRTAKKIYRHDMNLDEAIADPFIQQHCALIYTSASHRSDWHKFRLVFLLPEMVEDTATYEAMVRLLMERLPHDPSCKDASRIFYGSTKAEFPLINSAACLPSNWMQEAIAAAQKKKQEKAELQKLQALKKQQFQQLAKDEDWNTDQLIEQALNFIPPRQPGSGNYQECIQVLMALVDYYGESEAEAIAERWSPSIKGDTWNIPRKIRSFKRKSISIGTLFHTAKQYGFRFPSRSKTFQRSIKRKRIREERLKKWEGKLGSLPKSEVESRKAVNERLAAGQLLQQPDFEFGEFSPLAIPDQRKLEVLDGQKATRKTSTAIYGKVQDARSKSKTVLVVVPTRVLAESVAKVLGIACYRDEDLTAAPSALTVCPESLDKFKHLPWDVLVIDEANIVVSRSFACTLGNRPKQARSALVKIAQKAGNVVLAQDGIYSSVVNAMQRIGRFDASQVVFIRRRRTPTEMNIKLYLGQVSELESEDGVKVERGQADPAYHGWLRALLLAVAAGERVAIPCGSQEQACVLAKLLKILYLDKKIAKFDGQESFPKRRRYFARTPDKFLEQEKPDVVIFSPCFDTGVSQELNYFTTQFEYVRASEQASNASQRGERVRAAIGGGLIEKRHVYVSQHGLSTNPDPEIFTPEYWDSLVKGEVLVPLKGSRTVADQIGAAQALDRKQEQSLEEIADFPEVMQFGAIAAREIYFKVECLEAEWLGNGWTIERGDRASKEVCKQQAQMLRDVREGRLQKKSRCYAMAKPVDLGKDGEPSGPIEAIKSAKFSVGQIVGTQYSGLNTPEFWASWHLERNSGASLNALQLRALLHMQMHHSGQWQELQKHNVHKLIAEERVEETDSLRIPRKIIATAQLLEQCSSIASVLSGELQEWDKTTAEVTAAAAWAREHARELAALSRQSQRIHGLQFKDTTADIKCFHKLLSMIGIEAHCTRREGTGERNWQYRPKTAADIEEAIAKQKEFNPKKERDLYRIQTAEEITDQILLTLQQHPLLRSFLPSTTSADGLITEVVDEQRTCAAVESEPIVDGQGWFTPESVADILDMSRYAPPEELARGLNCPKEVIERVLAMA